VSAAFLQGEGIALHFGGVTALHDVSFAGERGSLFTIIGPNGAGKTSLFNVITGLYRMDAGDIYLDGRRISYFPPHAVARVGIVRTFFTPERTRRILAGKGESAGNVFAALLGIVTPFCSCSAVPLFIGFVTSGVPLGVTFSFLVSAPMVNEIALVLLFGLFGWKIA